MERHQLLVMTISGSDERGALTWDRKRTFADPARDKGPIVKVAGWRDKFNAGRGRVSFGDGHFDTHVQIGPLELD